MPRPFKKNSKLRQARLAKGFTLMQLAKLVGICYTTLSTYEAGRSVPSIAVFQRFKRILHLPGDFADYFDRSVTKRGSKRKYKDVKCKKEGCENIAAANGWCMTHYVAAWKRRKEDDKDQLLSIAWKRVAQLEAEKKKY